MRAFVLVCCTLVLSITGLCKSITTNPAMT